MKFTRTPVLLCIGLLLAPPLFAAAPDPADPSAPAPAAAYHSAFEGYRGYREEPLADWRAVNDEVGRVGGHAGIFRGAGGQAGHGAATAAPSATEGQSPGRGAPQAPAPAGHPH
jgi:hypothetical protein